MPKLKLRFSGLCLHRPGHGRVDVLHAIPGANQKSRDGKDPLTIHRPQLWVEGPTPVTQRGSDAETMCFVRDRQQAECRRVRIFDLFPGEALRVADGSGPDLDWTGLPATSLQSLHGSLSKPRKFSAVTTFGLDKGQWHAGPRFEVKWHPSGKIDQLPLWTELALDVPGDSVRIESTDDKSGWKLFPNAKDEVLVWVTSHPAEDDDHPGHGNEHPHGGQAGHHATHFKWFYECVDFEGVVPKELESPILEESLPQCVKPCGGAAGPTSSIFCPDSGYP